MVLSNAGIAAGWKTEKMPESRIMSVGVLMPDGTVLITGGAGTGAFTLTLDARNSR